MEESLTLDENSFRELLGDTKFNKILIIYQIGSRFSFYFNILIFISKQIKRVYGTHKPTSDYDFIAIIDEEPKRDSVVKTSISEIDIPFEMFDNKEIQIMFIPCRTWQMMSWTHTHESIECLSLQEKFVNKKKFIFSIFFD